MIAKRSEGDGSHKEVQQRIGESGHAGAPAQAQAQDKRASILRGSEVLAGTILLADKIGE